MSLKKIFVSITGFVFICTSVGVYGLYNKKSTARIPAAIDRNYRPITFGKMHKPFDIQIYADTDAPEQNESEFVIKAQVVMLGGSKRDLDYKWILPEGVSIVQGELEDTWPQVTPGQVIETSITVVGLTKLENKLVVLNVSKLDGTKTIGSSSVYASKPEDTLEYDAPNVRAAAEEGRRNENGLSLSSEEKPEELSTESSQRIMQ